MPVKKPRFVCIPVHTYLAKQKETKHRAFLMPVCGKDKFDLNKAAAAEAFLICPSEAMGMLWRSTDVSSGKGHVKAEEGHPECSFAANLTLSLLHW